MWRLLRASALLCIASFTLLVDAGEPQAPCPQGGEACLEGRSLGPTADELSALGAGLKCPGLHDGPDFATALAAKFKAHDNGPCIGNVWHPIEPSWCITCGWDSQIKLWD